MNEIIKAIEEALVICSPIIFVICFLYLLSSVLEIDFRKKCKAIDKAIKLGFDTIEFDENGEVLRMYNESSDNDDS